jgi:hypothetical protein
MKKLKPYLIYYLLFGTITVGLASRGQKSNTRTAEESQDTKVEQQQTQAATKTITPRVNRVNKVQPKQIQVQVESPIVEQPKEPVQSPPPVLAPTPTPAPTPAPEREIKKEPEGITLPPEIEKKDPQKSPEDPKPKPAPQDDIIIPKVTKIDPSPEPAPERPERVRERENDRSSREHNSKIDET